LNPTAVTRTPVWSWVSAGANAVWNVRYSPDGTKIAAAGEDKTVSILTPGGTLVTSYSAPARTMFYGMDWSPDGQFIAAGGADHTIHALAAADGSLYETLTGHAEGVTAVAWSHDGCGPAPVARGEKLDNTSHTLGGYISTREELIRIWSYR